MDWRKLNIKILLSILNDLKARGIEDILIACVDGFNGLGYLSSFWGPSHILVDTIGLIHSLIVHEVNIHDSVGAKLVLLKAKNKMPRLQVIWADSAMEAS